VLIIPAIDIRDGKCVRLYQGDFNRETVFSDDPVSMAERWSDRGATTLHVVDLDGAKQGFPKNLGLVESIIRATGAIVHFGGGLRTRSDIERAFNAGVAKVNIGTALVSDPDFLEWVVAEHGRKVLAALDCRDGMVVSRAWLNDTGISAAETAARLMAAGISDFVYTDVSRDGTMSGPDVAGIVKLLDSGAGVIASGGVSRLEDIAGLSALAKRGIKGIIIGRALYAASFTLTEAMAAARSLTLR